MTVSVSSSSWTLFLCLVWLWIQMATVFIGHLLEQVSLFIEICISVIHILHLTKMTFHRIVLFDALRHLLWLFVSLLGACSHRGG